MSIKEPKLHGSFICDTPKVNKQIRSQQKQRQTQEERSGQCTQDHLELVHLIILKLN